MFDPENESRPYIGINAVIIKQINGKPHILLGIRKNVTGAGRYYIPGGHLKIGETVHQAAIREIKEETNLDIAPGRCVWIEENLKGLHHVILYIESALVNSDSKPVNMEPQKCKGWEWYDPEMPPAPLWQSLKLFLKTYSESRISRLSIERPNEEDL